MSTLLNAKKGRIALAGLFALFAGGLQAMQPEGLLPKAEVKALIVNARMKADHMKLARHFQAKAQQMEAEAKEHEELAKEYRRSPTGDEQKHPGSGRTASHCEYFAEQLAKAAREARLLAADHEQMAEAAEK